MGSGGSQDRLPLHAFMSFSWQKSRCWDPIPLAKAHCAAASTCLVNGGSAAPLTLERLVVLSGYAIIGAAMSAIVRQNQRLLRMTRKMASRMEARERELAAASGGSAN
ncbi:hypothetical protein OC835_007764, partial [Tilletia horrida]